MSSADRTPAGRSAPARHLVKRRATRGARSGLLCTLLAALIVPPLAALNRGEDIHAVAIAPAGLAAEDASRRIVSTALDGGFNTVFLPIPLDGSVDSLDRVVDEVIRAAHDRGLRVHALVKALVAAAPGELPAARDHVVFRRPEWLMVPRELALEMLDLDFRSPDYVGRLARWTRANPDRAGGLALSPLQPAAAAYVAEALIRLVRRYAFDGVHLEGLRLPAHDFDYSRIAMDAFRQDVWRGLSEAERARLEEVRAIDPFGYVEELPDDWHRFRVTRLTSLVTRLRTAIRSVRPDAIVSAAVLPDPDHAFDLFLQDWRTWLDNGFVDALAAGEGGTGKTLLFSYEALLRPAAANAPAGAATAAAGSQ